MVRPEFTSEEVKIILGALESKNHLVLDAIASCIDSNSPEFEKKHLETRKIIHRIALSLGGQIDDGYRMKHLLAFKKKKLEQNYQ